MFPGGVKDVRVWERQRYYPIKGWTKMLLPTDRGPFLEDETGTQLPDLAAAHPPPGRVWSGAWRRNADSGGTDGWSYAIDWPRKFTATKAFSDFVRQRAWLRSTKCTFQTRHHCRRCGALVCDACAPESYVRPLPRDFGHVLSLALSRALSLSLSFVSGASWPTEVKGAGAAPCARVAPARPAREAIFLCTLWASTNNACIAHQAQRERARGAQCRRD